MKTCLKCGSSEFVKNGKYTRCKACADRYYIENRERKLATKKLYREKNKDVIKKKKLDWDTKNKEYILQKAKEYSLNNPVKRRIHQQNRRARCAGGKLSKNIVEKLYKLQHGRCPACHLALKDDYHLDHIMPLSLGGTNTDDNVQLLHSTCNQQKHSKHPIDFMQSRGFLL